MEATPHYPYATQNNSISDNITSSSCGMAENQSYISPSNSKFNSQNIADSNISTNRQMSSDSMQKNNLRPNLNRNRDEVYLATKNVVKAIITLSQVVGENKGNNYLDLVKDIGFELRKLLQSVDHISPLIPAEAYK